MYDMCFMSQNTYVNFIVKIKFIMKLGKISNRLNLMFVRMTFVDSIKIVLPKTNNAKEFVRLVGQHSQITDKSLAGTLMSTLTTMKFDGSCTMHEHVIAARLKTLGMTVTENFLI